MTLDADEQAIRTLIDTWIAATAAGDLPRNQLTTTITPASGAPMRMSGPSMSVLRKHADSRWLLFRDANMVTPETQR